MVAYLIGVDLQVDIHKLESKYHPQTTQVII